MIEDFGLQVPGDWDWPEEVWQDMMAPIIVDRGDGPEPLLASYGMIPKKRLKPGVRISTMNARTETVESKPSFREAWSKFQFCLVPMLGFYEPCYESGSAERMKIGVAGGGSFAVAGLYRSWSAPDDPIAYSFTQLTINADSHPLMSRMHRPGDEKRSLVMLPVENYIDWLKCRNAGIARSLLFLSNEIQMDCTSFGGYKKTTLVSQGG
ncbi:MAG: SOS response-associated peptidase [Burkholderiales bacterium]|nr:SOS response-associated peptidase [Burkholderiales bacterium]